MKKVHSEAGTKKRTKPSHNTLQNVIWMLHNAWKSCRTVPLWCVVLAALTVGLNQRAGGRAARDHRWVCRAAVRADGAEAVCNDLFPMGTNRGTNGTIACDHGQGPPHFVSESAGC